MAITEQVLKLLTPPAKQSFSIRGSGKLLVVDPYKEEFASVRVIDLKLHVEDYLRRPIRLTSVMRATEFLGFTIDDACELSVDKEDKTRRHDDSPTPERRSPASRSGIYFFHAADVNAIKIGWAMDIDDRFRQVRLLSPVPLSILAYVPDATVSDEKSLHRAFSSARIHSEWFTATPQLMDFISKEARQW